MTRKESDIPGEVTTPRNSIIDILRKAMSEKPRAIHKRTLMLENGQVTHHDLPVPGGSYRRLSLVVRAGASTDNAAVLFEGGGMPDMSKHESLIKNESQPYTNVIDPLITLFDPGDDPRFTAETIGRIGEEQGCDENTQWQFVGHSLGAPEVIRVIREIDPNTFPGDISTVDLISPVLDTTQTTVDIAQAEARAAALSYAFSPSNVDPWRIYSAVARADRVMTAGEPLPPSALDHVGAVRIHVSRDDDLTDPKKGIEKVRDLKPGAEVHIYDGMPGHGHYIEPEGLILSTDPDAVSLPDTLRKR